MRRWGGDAMLGWGIAMEMQEKPAEAEHAYMRGLEVDEGRVDLQEALDELLGEEGGEEGEYEEEEDEEEGEE